MLRKDDIPALLVGWFNSEGRGEIGHEDGVAGDEYVSGVVGVAVVPHLEPIAGLGVGMDADVFVVAVVAFAADGAEVFVVGDDAHVVVAAIEGASVEFDVVAEPLSLACALDAVGVGGVGVVGGAVVDDSLDRRGVGDIEFVAGLGRRAGVVVDCNEQVVGTIVDECGVERYLVPALMEGEVAAEHLCQLFEGHHGKGVAELRLVSVGEIDGAVVFGDGLAVGIVEADGVDVFGAVKLFGQENLLGVVVFF